MLLFLDRFPLHVWSMPGDLVAAPRWSVLLPMLLAESGLEEPPRLARPQRWVFDTAFTGEAFAWRHHLQEVGLDPNAEQVGYSSLTPAFGGTEQVPVREADVWLFSNVAALRDAPYCVSLQQGVAFRNVATLPDPLVNRPVIGVRAMRRAGLRVLVDFAADTISVWVPAPWHRAVVSGLRRRLSTRVPPEDLWLPDQTRSA